MKRLLQDSDGGWVNGFTLFTSRLSAAVARAMVRQRGAHTGTRLVVGLSLGLMLSVATARLPHPFLSNSPGSSRAALKPAVPKPGLPKLPIKMHPTSPKYAYGVVDATIRFNPLCGPGRTLLFVRAQVENSSANAVSMPVRVKIIPIQGIAKGGSAPVPRIAAHGSVWVRVPVPYPQQFKPGKAGLGVTLSFAGQTWSGGPLQFFLSPNRCASRPARFGKKLLRR